MRFAVSVVVLFVASMGFGFLVHGLLLHDEYASIPNLMRTEEEAHGRMHLMVLANLSIAVGLTWIYLRGRQDRPWFAQGLRFGVAMALVTAIPMYLIYYTVCPFPASLVQKQLLFDGIVTLILGVVTAAINRAPRSA